MHYSERENVILEFLQERGFVSVQDLRVRMRASLATIRRDLIRLTEIGLITRVHGGAKLAARTNGTDAANECAQPRLVGIPFEENVKRFRRQKEVVGRAAAKLCAAGEAVMIDGGSTTLQMCPHLAGLNLQVLTNSLHIVNALMAQAGTRLLLTGGQVFPEQNVILSAADEDGMPHFHAPKLFLGATAVGALGIMQPDVVMVAAERRLIDRADQIIVLVDSSKFDGPSGHVVCPLEEIDVVITDAGICPVHKKMLERAGIRTIIARE